MSKILIISSNYPSPVTIYGDVFVHTRAKKYTAYFDVYVVGYISNLKAIEEYEFEGIQVYKTNCINDFNETIIKQKPDVVAVHFIQHFYMEFLLNLNKPLVVFIHGYEALSWRRRLMNYNSLGALQYLWAYIKENIEQRKALKKFQQQADKAENVYFVFVSKWLKDAVENDLGVSFKYAKVIPNGIDTGLFKYEKKSPSLRKKILIIRSFNGRNYANDIAIEAILKLSKKNYFSELEFCIYGEGFLFNSLTRKIAHLANVSVKNFFVINRDIPAIHKNFGIFLCPSRLDTQGVSMCEAMASGLVPITSPIGGIPEYAEHNKSAFLVNTSDEIVESVENLIKDPELFSKMSHHSHQAVVEGCLLEDTIKEELKLFELLLDKNKMAHAYQQCTRCVLDTNDDNRITFNDTGVCSYCQEYENTDRRLIKGDEAKIEFEKIIQNIKQAGKGKPYDCLLGLSGGVDSTYLAYKAKEAGLRPLAVHFDNGWNSELAVGNIENIVTRLDIPLHTFVVDWDEFKDIQLSLIKASVVDIEIATDHAIITKLYQLALQFKIGFILSGSNVVTESILPAHWIFNKKDHVHIRSIHKQFGKVKLKSFPLFTSWIKWKVAWRNIQSISLLDSMPYNKSEVKEIITQKLGWRDYGGKHYESIFTRFYQGYILPKKFGIDKRKAHLSNLICSGQMLREDAIKELAKPAYDEAVCKRDYEFVLKKLELSEDEFTHLLNAPVKKHLDYPVETDFYERFPPAKFVAPFWRGIKRLKTRS